MPDISDSQPLGQLHIFSPVGEILKVDLSSLCRCGAVEQHMTHIDCHISDCENKAVIHIKLPSGTIVAVCEFCQIFAG
jgi:hypothetical protein